MNRSPFGHFNAGDLRVTAPCISKLVNQLGIAIPIYQTTSIHAFALLLPTWGAQQMTNLKENPSATNTGASIINTLPEHAKHDSKPIIKNKQCKACGNRKPVSEFAKNTKTQDGYLHTCLACLAANKRPPQSLRQSINAMCCSCLYDPISGEGNWRQQVTLCTSGNCPLFDVRPTSKGAL